MSQSWAQSAWSQSEDSKTEEEAVDGPGLILSFLSKLKHAAGGLWTHVPDVICADKCTALEHNPVLTGGFT